MFFFRRSRGNQRTSKPGLGAPRHSERARRYKPSLELLEGRLAPAVISVTTAFDDSTPNDGSVSLREAIQAINNGSNDGDPDIIAQNPGTFGVNDTINFALPQPVSGPIVQTINAGSTGNGALPELIKPMTINGYSEPGASANTLANGDNARILIEIAGSNAGPNAEGILLAATSGGSNIEGLAINRFSDAGIDIQSGGNVIAGNFVGTNPAGTVAEANQGDGIDIQNANGNLIGGATPASRNLVSGNYRDGIHIDGTLASPATGNLVEGNYVGVNAAGTGAVGLQPSGAIAGALAGNSLYGIEISGGDSNTIGGATAAARNVVGYNTDGIEIDNGGQNNLIQGNFSGVGADGVTPVGNFFHGIAVRSNDNQAPPFGPGQANEPPTAGNEIGLDPFAFAGLGNLIEFNGSAGVAIFGNPPQNNSFQTQNSGNSILGNSIFKNGQSNPTALIGIDLSNQFVYPKDDGVTANDSGKNTMGQAAHHGDPSNPNNFQNAPVLTSVATTASTTTIKGTLTQSVSPNTTYRIEFFATDFDVAGVITEGQSFLGAVNVTSNASGIAAISATLNTPVAAGRFITATATNTTADPSSPGGTANLFNTSEFSHAIFVGTASQAFLFKVYRDLLNRPADAAGLAYWTGQLSQGVTPTQVAQMIENSVEYHADLVQTAYRTFLHRSADTVGLINNVNFLAAGGTLEQLDIALLGSAEYFTIRGAGTNAGFINALYLDLLGRGTAGDTGAQGFINALNNNSMTRTQIATIVQKSTEGLQDLVQSFYREFLFRVGVNSELSGWVSMLQSGISQTAVLADILGSAESFMKPGF